ncbi:hypothetical protein [Nostoc sp.]|uniref:hypothetical protein n=1 Tax=Nostoc sp. TaxID=1180 RepID=UPI002FF4EC36
MIRPFTFGDRSLGIAIAFLLKSFPSVILLSPQYMRNTHHFSGASFRPGVLFASAIAFLRKSFPSVSLLS